MRKNKKRKLSENEYDVTMTAVLVVRVKSVNAYRAIGKAEDAVQDKLSGVEIESLKTTCSKSI